MPHLKTRLATTLFAFLTVVAPVFMSSPISAESATPVYEWTAYFETVSGIGATIDEIEVADDGSVYGVGNFYGTVDFDPTGAGEIHSESGGPDTFITKRASNGSHLWTRTIGDPLDGQATGSFPEDFVTLDDSGNIYVTGIFDGTVNFNPLGSDVRTATTITDLFVTRWNSDGSYGWTHTIGSPALTLPPYESVTSIVTDSSGNAYFGGEFSGTTDFDEYGAGDIQSVVDVGDRDAFVTKINDDGSYGWTRTFGSDGLDFINLQNLIIPGDDSGIFTPVTFNGTSIDADPEAGVVALTPGNVGDESVALIKLDESGSHVWSSVLGNDSNTDIRFIETDDTGALYLLGLWGSTLDFDPGPGTELATATHSSAAYLMKLNNDGTYSWHKHFGGDGFMDIAGLEMGNEGVYVSQLQISSIDWDINQPDSAEIITAGGAGNYNNYVTKWRLDGSYEWTRGLATAEYEQEYELSVNASCDAVYTLGEVYPSVTGPVPFDSQGTDTRTVPDTGAFYVTRYSTRGQYTWSNVVDTADDYFYVTRTATGPNDSIYYAGDAQGAAINFHDGGTDVINAGTSDVSFISKLSNSLYRQHVLNLDGSVGALETASGDDAKLGNIGVQRVSNTNVQVEDAADGLAVAEIGTDLSCDRDWSGVDAESDEVSGEAFVAGLTSAEGTDATLDLFVPKLPSSTGVGVCPGAASLAALSESCGGYYELADGDASLSESTIDGTEYWRVLGVTDGGGFNTTGEATPPTTDPDTPADSDAPDDPEEDILAPTGAPAGMQLMAGVLVLGAVWYVSPMNRRYSHPGFKRREKIH